MDRDKGHGAWGRDSLADVVERADVRVRERGDGPGLALEARAALRVGGEFSWEDLDGDRAVEAGVASLVNLSHAPGADQAEDFVRAEPRARSQRHCSSWRALYARAAARQHGHSRNGFSGP